MGQQQSPHLAGYLIDPLQPLHLLWTLAQPFSVGKPVGNMVMHAEWIKCLCVCVYMYSHSHTLISYSSTRSCSWHCFWWSSWTAAHLFSSAWRTAGTLQLKWEKWTDILMNKHTREGGGQYEDRRETMEVQSSLMRRFVSHFPQR